MQRSSSVGAVAPEAVPMTGDPVLRVLSPLHYQGRTVGGIVTELDVTDLLAERRQGDAVAAVRQRAGDRRF